MAPEISKITISSAAASAVSIGAKEEKQPDVKQEAAGAGNAYKGEKLTQEQQRIASQAVMNNALGQILAQNKNLRSMTPAQLEVFISKWNTPEQKARIQSDAANIFSMLDAADEAVSAELAGANVSNAGIKMIMNGAEEKILKEDFNKV